MPQNVAMRAIPSPAEISRRLEHHVVGQSLAVRELSVALAKKLAGLRVGNVLLIGASGTGKTTLMRSVEAFLASDPELAIRSTVARLHANVLGEEAERGRAGEVVLRRLAERAREALGHDAAWAAVRERVMNGIAFVDEVDKIRSLVGDRPNVSGIRAQEALLTLMENEAVSFVRPEWAGAGAEEIDSSGVLFVCGGAFEGLYDAVYDRVTIGRDRGALKSTTVVEGGRMVEKQIFRLRDWLKPEDLFDYGMTPQFLARFDAVVLLEALGESELIKIFLEAPDSGLAQSRAFFASRGLEFAISPSAVRRLARHAANQPRLGARALREAFRRVVRDLEFDPEGHARNGVISVDDAEVVAALGE
jgi:ATP-dependent Clp protease ATP-binding subunit ClpX